MAKSKKIFECRVLHDDWEMDNSAWVIELPNGKVADAFAELIDGGDDDQA